MKIGLCGSIIFYITLTRFVHLQIHRINEVHTPVSVDMHVIEPTIEQHVKEDVLVVDPETDQVVESKIDEILNQVEEVIAERVNEVSSTDTDTTTPTPMEPLVYTGGAFRGGPSDRFVLTGYMTMSHT